MTRDYVLEWLRVLGAAVSARQLYKTDHPRVIAAVESLASATDQLVGHRADVTLFMVEDRLTCDGEVVPGAGPTAARVFAILAARGYDRVVVKRGIGSNDLGALVSGLAAGAAGSTGDALQSTSHLRLSALDMNDVARSSPARPVASTHAERLHAVWRGIDERREVDRSEIEGLVRPLVEMVVGGGRQMLPLAAIASHDEYTATHISNVAILTIAIAEVLQVPGAHVRDVGIAALLHDIGKLRVPEHVLNSERRLTPDELVLVRRHPVTGAQMLVATPGLPKLAAIVAFEHHLQAGGGGYPRVPSGWAINPASAMTHVADVYDALRTNRPYRPALEHAQILEIMRRDRGTVFDPIVLDAFFDHVLPRAAVVEPEPRPA